MGMVVLSFLVVVDQLDVKRICALKPENNTPVGPHRDGPKPLQVALKGVKTITGKVHRPRRVGLIEADKDIVHDLQQVGPYSAPIAELVEALQAPVFEAPDQRSQCKAYIVSCQARSPPVVKPPVFERAAAAHKEGRPEGPPHCARMVF